MNNRSLPESGATLAGYASLIATYGLHVPIPDTLSAISVKHTRYNSEGWQVFTPRHAPKDNLYGHLVFALRYEGVDLGILKALFDRISPGEIEPYILAELTGKYARRIWFFYEYLTDKHLNIPDATQGNFVGCIDEKLQYAVVGHSSKRHRIRNNLPGVKEFCPLIKRTEKLDQLIDDNLSLKVRENIKSATPDVLMRASAFMLLADSKASYAIEGETPPHHRAESWGHIIGKAGQNPLSHKELEHLQAEVITDSRFIRMGYRTEGGFVGSHDRITGIPLPEHISARHEDLQMLMTGLIETARLLRESHFPPVLAATVIAFGFVFIHPLEDGNGRIHRYLMHHVLMETGFTPKGIVFPVSSVILERLTEYKDALQAYSQQRLPLVEWRANEKGNVEVLNKTFDLYRFFDATKQAEFFYDCVHETITKALPAEIAYLEKYDLMKNFINNRFNIPDHTVNLLILFLSQNGGKISSRGKNKEFISLTNEEIEMLEQKFADIFRT